VLAVGRREQAEEGATRAVVMRRGYDATRSDGGAADNAKRVTMTASDKIGRQMMQRKQAADDGSGAEDDQMYLPRVFFYNCIQFIFVNSLVYLQIEQFI